MIKDTIVGHRLIKRNETYSAEPIEDKIRRLTTTNQPIDISGAAMEYTERKDGAKPEHNIRTDRMDIAIEAMGAVTKSQIAKRRTQVEPGEPIQATEE